MEENSVSRHSPRQWDLSPGSLESIFIGFSTAPLGRNLSWIPSTKIECSRGVDFSHRELTSWIFSSPTTETERGSTPEKDQPNGGYHSRNLSSRNTSDSIRRIYRGLDADPRTPVWCRVSGFSIATWWRMEAAVSSSEITHPVKYSIFSEF